MPWNVDTRPTDLERIRRVLKVPAEKIYLDIIRISMQRIEKESPETIDTVQELLDGLEGNRSSRAEAYSDAGYGLIKADVLEWEPGTKTVGLEVMRTEWIQELCATLLIEPPEWTHGTYVVRS